jgi:hypothetical protein
VAKKYDIKLYAQRYLRANPADKRGPTAAVRGQSRWKSAVNGRKMVKLHKMKNGTKKNPSNRRFE